MGEINAKAQRTQRIRIFLGHAHMKTIARLIGVTIIVLLALAACERGSSTSPSTDPMVEQKASVLFDALKAGDLDTALAQYAEGFFQSRSPEEWREQLQKIGEERGPLQAYYLRRAQADTRLSGKFFILEYEGVYQGKQRVNHILTLVAPAAGGEMQLVGHKLMPWEAEE